MVDRPCAYATAFVWDSQFNKLAGYNAVEDPHITGVDWDGIISRDDSVPDPNVGTWRLPYFTTYCPRDTYPGDGWYTYVGTIVPRSRVTGENAYPSYSYSGYIGNGDSWSYEDDVTTYTPWGVPGSGPIDLRNVTGLYEANQDESLGVEAGSGIVHRTMVFDRVLCNGLFCGWRL